LVLGFGNRHRGPTRSKKVELRRSPEVLTKGDFARE